MHSGRTILIEKQRLLDDRKIVDLFWGRDELALSESARKYGALLESASPSAAGSAKGRRAARGRGLKGGPASPEGKHLAIGHRETAGSTVSGGWIRGKYQEAGWLERLGGGTSAEGIVDRTSNNAYCIKPTGDVDMRDDASKVK